MLIAIECDGECDVVDTMERDVEIDGVSTKLSEIQQRCWIWWANMTYLVWSIELDLHTKCQK